MDLQALLKKTKQRADRVKVDRLPPSIATKDRPYEAPSPAPVAPLDKAAAVTIVQPVEPITTTLEAVIPSLAVTTQPIAVEPKPLSPPVAAPIVVEVKPEPPKETAHKPDTKRLQTEHKPNTEQATNRAQTVHSTRAAPEPQKRAAPKPDTQPDTVSDTKWTQTAHKQDTKTGFGALIGIQREIAVFVYQACQSARAKVTEPLTLEHVATSLRIRTGSVKTTLRRLEEKGILRRVDFKNGRGGWSKYELLEGSFREMLQLETGHKLNTNRAQTGYKVDTKPDTELDTSRPSSSGFSLKDLKTTTTGEAELLKAEGIFLAPEWLLVDFSALAEIGFTQTHLVQIVRQGKLAPQEVQDSIEFFAFDLKRNGLKPNGPPLNFFMGILRKGIPYAPPENFESAADEARRKMIEFKARKEQEREAQLKRLVDLEFSTWRHELSAAQIAAIVPEYAKKPGPMQDSFLKGHFENEIWPAISATVPGMTRERADIQREIEQSLTGDGT